MPDYRLRRMTVNNEIDDVKKTNNQRNDERP